ncbi:MAG: PorV/PorQ family protein [Flavobacteriales bacterium]
MNIPSYITKTAALLALSILASTSVRAGNEDRAGQAGAPELLINPWAASAGWGMASMAGATGIDATFLNVAGIARNTSKFELGFNHTNYWAGIGISAAGFNARVSEESVFGITLMTLNSGDIDRTTVEAPSGNTEGTFSFGNTIIGIQYAKNFTPAISGGINMKIVNEGTADISATGVAIDVGVQYFAGDNEKMKFGVALKNIGAKMSFTGDGDDQSLLSGSGDFNQTYEYRESQFELPVQMVISGSYDFQLDSINKITPAAAFTSNSFIKDRLSIGAEYAYKENLKVHVGYDHEAGVFDDYENGRTTALTGLSAGFVFSLPVGALKDQQLSVSYAYRSADPFKSPHAFGLNLKL